MKKGKARGFYIDNKKKERKKERKNEVFLSLFYGKK